MGFKYEGRHKGELIAVLGCGPSIENVDVRLLPCLTTIGTNRIGEFYETDYLVYLDRKFRENFGARLAKTRAIKFHNQRIDTPYVYHKFIKHLPKDTHDFLSNDFKKGLLWSYTSIFPAINLAYLFGAAGIVLLGVDFLNDAHFYVEEDSLQRKNRAFNGLKAISSHFDKLKAFCASSGFFVLNANQSSAVKNFSFVDFDKDFLRTMQRSGLKLKGCDGLR